MTTSVPIPELCASGPCSEHAEALELYGRFVGSWELDVISYAPEGGTQVFSDIGESSFGWRSEISEDGGKTFQLRQRFVARRRGAPST